MGYGYDRQGNLQELKLDLIGVRRAFIHAPCHREVYVDLPAEDAEPGMCGKLVMAMYGTRDAPQNCEFEYTDFMIGARFTQGKSTPCLFYHEPRNLRVVVYGDDFTVLGPEGSLDWFRKQMQKRYEVEFKARLGMGDNDGKSVSLLNRPIELHPTGISYEADQRHVEIIRRDLGLGDKVRHTPFPYERPSAEEVASESPELDPARATQYRAIVARANYLSQDRSDIRYAVKELSRSMSCPCEKDWPRLKRLGRYLVQHPRLIPIFRRQSATKFLDVWVDTDFAGCLKTRKSTSGGVLVMEIHFLKGWSRTQQSITPSSAEAELVAMCKLSAELLGVLSMLKDLGEVPTGTVLADSTAAFAIEDRRGSG